MSLPEFGNPRLLAEQGRRFSGTLALSCFERLSASLADTQGGALYTLAFSLEAAVGAQLHGEVSTRLPLTCQRCLKRFELPVTRQWRLVLIEHPGEERLHGEDENVFLVPDGQMRLLELVEDELILALPLVPRHEDEQRCDLPGERSAEQSAHETTQNPFASLEALKKHHQE